MDVNASRLSEEGDINVNEALHRILIMIIMSECPLGEGRLGGTEKARGSLSSALVDCTSHRGLRCSGETTVYLLNMHRLFAHHCSLNNTEYVHNVGIKLTLYITRNDLKSMGGWV